MYLASMQLLDIAKRNWSEEVLEKLGIEREYLADVYESCYISAKVNKKAAELTGLKEGTPVAGGAGDQAESAVGSGIVNKNRVSSTIGTSGVVFAYTDKPIIDMGGRVHTFCHAIPNAWHVMGVTQAAGLSLKWFRDNFCMSEMETAKQMGIDPYILMDREAESVPAGSNDILYLPYLMGERTPHLNPDARGVFFGLFAIHTRRDMLRAVMEGVAYSLKDCLELLKEIGVTTDQIIASGGGGKSKLWRQMQADMFGCDVCTTNNTENNALGVAILAGTGVGLWSSVEDACNQLIKVNATAKAIEPNVHVYNRQYQKYRALYKALEGLYGM